MWRAILQCNKKNFSKDNKSYYVNFLMAQSQLKSGLNFVGTKLSSMFPPTSRIQTKNILDFEYESQIKLLSKQSLIKIKVNNSF